LRPPLVARAPAQSESTGTTTYAADARSLLRNVYTVIHFVARRVGGGEGG
jgi:hypothetical protein